MKRNSIMVLFLAAAAGVQAAEIREYRAGDEMPAAVKGVDQKAATVSEDSRTVPVVLFGTFPDKTQAYTQFVLMNLTNKPVTAYFDFYDDLGRSVAVPLGLGTINTVGRWSSAYFTAGGWEAGTVWTNYANEEGQRVWARIRSVPEGAVGVQVITCFRDPWGRETATSHALVTRREGSPVFLFTNNNPMTTRFALVNDSDFRTGGSLIARDDQGRELCRQDLYPVARGAMYMNLADALPCTAGRFGSLQLLNPQGNLSGLTYLANGDNYTMTALQPLQTTAR